MAFIYYAAGAAIVYSVYQADKEADRANDLNKQSLEMQRESLAFSKKQYEDWQGIYGGIEQNLSEFYSNLTPDYIEAQGLQASQLQYQNSIEEMNTFFASAGIESGAQAEVMAGLALQNARNEATIRVEAPFKVAQEKSSFLSLGLNQKAGAASSVTNSLDSMSNTLQEQSNQASARSNQAFNMAGDALAIGVDEYSRRNPPIPRKANQGVTTVKGGND